MGYGGMYGGSPQSGYGGMYGGSPLSGYGGSYGGSQSGYGGSPLSSYGGSYGGDQSSMYGMRSIGSDFMSGFDPSMQSGSRQFGPDQSIFQQLGQLQDVNQNGVPDHLEMTKSKIDDYLAKTQQLGNRKLSVQLEYLNTPLEYQYLSQVRQYATSF